MGLVDAILGSRYNFDYPSPILLTFTYGLTTCYCEEKGHTPNHTVHVQERGAYHYAHGT